MSASSKKVDLKIIHGGGEDAWHRKLVELLDGDAWKLADTLLEEYPVEDYPDDGTRKNGLYEALLQDEEALRRKYGIIATRTTLRIARATAIAWPDDTRVSSTSFSVHRSMRGKDRQAEMAKRLRQAEREKTALTAKMVARLRADENKKPGKPYNERMKHAIASAVKREMLGGITTKRPDWWMAVGVGDGDRDIAVQVLRALASEIAKGTK